MTRPGRLALALVVLVSPSEAWEFSPDPVCTLVHSELQAEMRVTYDPQTMLYTMAIRKPVPWVDASSFSIRFEGARELIISTDRHQLSDGKRVLTVTDTGFGNVLDGLEYNATAMALSGDGSSSFSLIGAGEPVKAFRACAAALAV